MDSFDKILEAARTRAGGDAALDELMPEAKTADGLKAVPDDRYLSLMQLRVFSAGLRHSMVRDKWPAFEEVFMGFDPRRIRAMNDEALEGLMSETRIIRHWGKIKSVRANAAAMCDLADEQGGFGAYLAAWPGERIVDLWADLATRFSQLGGNSGPYFLRMVGKDTFVLTGDVVKALNMWGGFDGEPKGKRARAMVQEAINQWAGESGRPLAHISRILALSVD